MKKFKYLTLLLKNHFLYGDMFMEKLIIDNKLKDIEFLIGQGLNINEKNPLGDTPLYIACNHRRFDIIDLLLENKADPNITSRFNESPLLCLSKKEYEESIKSQLFECMNKLVNSGADINLKDVHENNCLSYYICAKNLTGVQWVMTNGGDIHCLNEKHYTPLLYTAIAGTESIIDYLIPFHSVEELNEIQSNLIPFSMEYEKLYHKIEIRRVTLIKEGWERDLTEKKSTIRLKI